MFEPVDYLQAEVIDDDILGHRLTPHSGGHDAWGFRNKNVPETADIVTLGDSQTYGASANASHSWPALLQQLSGKTVYNLGLGGYSPVQYAYLLSEKALQLKPSLVLVGFYYGNDLYDAAQLVYTHNYWDSLRSELPLQLGDLRTVDLDIYAAKTPFTPLRVWFAQHSILYRFLFYSVFGNLVKSAEREFHALTKADYVYLEDTSANIRTAFTPEKRLKALDLQNPAIQEGLRVSLKLFSQMNALCKTRNIRFAVVLIPTKERVFSDHFKKLSPPAHAKIMNELLMNERQVHTQIHQYFDQHHIAYIDVLPALKSQVGKIRIYPAHHDGHPNQYGYNIIATRIYQFLAEREHE